MSQDQVSELPKLGLEDVPAHVQKSKRGNRRTSVSAECGDGTSEPYVQKIIPKSEDALRSIKQAMSSCFLFSSLDKKQEKDIIDSMEEKKIAPGDVIIKQGGLGDFFYVIDHGKYDVFKKIEGEDKKVFAYDEKGSFGELALMYNCPRMATVKATTDGVLWAVDRMTFRHIIIAATAKQRKLYEIFLLKVPLLAKLSPQERSLIADSLEPLTFENGSSIITQGEEGLKMYLLEEGECVATQVSSETKEPVEVGRMREGDFFGERALLTNEPRAASVQAVGEVRVAALSKDAFERLLGDVKDIMHRQLQRYKSANDVVALKMSALSVNEAPQGEAAHPQEEGQHLSAN